MGGIIPIQIFKNFSGSVNSHEIKLTGKQGDVMKESVACSLTTAINYLAKNKKKYKIKDMDDYLTKISNMAFMFIHPLLLLLKMVLVQDVLLQVHLSV